MVATIVLGALLAFAVFALVVWVLAEVSFRKEYTRVCHEAQGIELSARIRYAARLTYSESATTIKGKIHA